MPSKALGAGLAVVALVLLASHAQGQDASPGAKPAPTSDAEADAFFRAGSAAYAQREYRAAAQAYEEAYKRAPRGAPIYNAAAAWEAAGEHGRALEAFERALGHDDLEDSLRRAARDRRGALRRVLGCISFRGPESWSVSIAHAQRRPLPTQVCVAPGERAYVLEGPDRGTLSGSASVEAGRTVDAAPPPPRAPRTARPTRPPQRSTPSRVPRAQGNSQQVWGLVALGGAAAAAGAAAFLGVKTLDTLDAFDASGHHDTELHDDAIAYRAWTNVAWVGAVILGGVGVVLLLTAPSAGTSVRSFAPVDGTVRF